MTGDKKTELVNDKIIIFIPGVISKKRKYSELINDVISDITLKEKVEYIILGYPIDSYGYAIVYQARHLLNEGYHVTVFDKFVPLSEFDRHIQSCDIILSIFDIIYINNDGQVELYGQSKETGVSLLAWCYAKPLIIPTDYIPLHEIRGQTIRYRDHSDINQIIQHLATNKYEMQKLAQTAYHNLSNFNMTPTIASLKKIMNNNHGNITKKLV